MAAWSGEVGTKNMTAFGTPSAQDCDLHGHSAGFVIEKIILFSVTITGYIYRQNPPQTPQSTLLIKGTDEAEQV